MTKLNKLTFALRFLPIVPIGALIWAGCYPQYVPDFVVYELAFGVIWAVIAGNPWAVLSRWLSPLSRAVIASGLLMAYAGYKLVICTSLVRCVLLTLGFAFCAIAYQKRREWLGVFAVFQSWRVDEVINVFTYAVENDALEAWENGGCGELRAVLRQSLHVNLSEEALTYSHKAAFLLGYLRGADIQLQDSVNYYQGQIDHYKARAEQAEREATTAHREAAQRVKDVQSRYAYIEEQYERYSTENSVLRDKVRGYEDPLSVGWEEYWGCQKSMDEIMEAKGWRRIRDDEPAAVPVPVAAPASSAPDLLQGISPAAFRLAGWKSWDTMTAEAEEQTPEPVKLRLVPQQDDEPDELEEIVEDEAEELALAVGDDRPTWSTLDERNELIRQYKADGHSHPQTAERFGITVSLSKKICNAK